MEISNIILLATEQAVEHAVEASQQTGGFIGTLGLNWKLFLAQLVNFTIVILILWKWAFKPITRALESRREKIERSVKQAEEIEERMKEFEKHTAEQMTKARLEAEAIIKRAQELAGSSKQEIVANAQSQADKILAEAKMRIESEKEKMFVEIREEVVNLTIMAAEKILREKLDEKNDKKMVEEILTSIKR